jgi:hypothetical protein
MGAGQSSSSSSGQKDPHDAIIPADVFTKLEKFREILDNFNKNEPNFVSKYIDDYNKSVPSNLQLNTASLGPQLSRIDQFHSLLVKKITGDPNANKDLLKTNPVVQQQFMQTMKNTNQLIGTDLPELAKGLISNEIQQLMNDSLIKKDANVRGTVNQILNQIVSMKARYSFFEYKYVQMNVLLLVIVQNMYSTMINAIKNIVELHEKQNEIRNKEVSQIFNLMLAILQSAELQITPQDFDKLSGLIDKVRADAERDHAELQKYKDKITMETVNFVSDTLDKATTQSTGITTTGTNMTFAPPAPASPTPTVVGGFVRDKSRTQEGGFVRFNSMFPAQEFHNIESLGA